MTPTTAQLPRAVAPDRFLASLLVVAAGVAAGQSHAFGGANHRLVAELAEQQLKPAVRTEVNRLLAQEPGASLQSVSTWADETRSLGTAAWHYVNFHRGEPCVYEAARLCIDGKCVVGALERQIELLGSKASDAQRLTALKYVMHLVADLHQPLHAGFFDDRGGNSYQLQALGKGTNLHAVWDSGLTNGWPDGVQALRPTVEGELGAVATGSSPAAWAEESCRIVGASGFYPDGRELDASYATRWRGVLAQRLAAAATRLAEVLNEALVTR
jgi:hypothetical protein